MTQSDIASQQITATSLPPFTDILKQVLFSSPNEIEKKETGKKIAQKIYSDQTSSETNLNYFRARSVKWINILKWATGIQDMQEFVSFFNVSDGNKAYVKIDMTPVMIGPQFVGTLVESMAQNEEYPQVSAIDDDSVQEKEERKQDALYRMYEAEKINNIQQSAGMHVEPPQAYVPDDELMAEVYFQLQDRLPKEIKFEKKLSNILSENKYERIQKRKTLYNLVVNNIALTKIERTGNGGYCIRIPVPQNCFYNYIITDSGKHELGYIGELYNLKIKDIRQKYGRSEQNPDGLTEKEIYDLAKIATIRNSGWFNFGWREEYSIYNYNRPWDDYSIYVMDFEIKVNTSDYYVGKPDSFGNENIAPKKGIPEPKSDKAKIYKKSKNRWYHGVYCPYADKILYWGQPDVVLLPFMDTEESLCSYSINIPFNNGQYVPSLFERAMEPLKEYALTKLKRKQLIAKLRPSGIRIDIESARNIDLGNGNSIPWEEIIRIFDQTGNELFSSRGVNPLEREGPAISNTAVDDAVQKIMQLTAVLQSSLQEIRQLLGVPTYRDGSDVGDRTSGKLADSQNTSSFNVTDFIPNANNELWEETLYKCCLLEWQKVVKTPAKGEEDLINTRFKVEVKMKLSAYEKQLLESDIAIGLKEGTLTQKDALYIREIKNFKLATLYLDSTIQKNKRDAAKMQQDNVMQTANAQQASNAQTAQNQAALEQQQAKTKMDQDNNISKNKKEEILLQGVIDMLKTGMPIPPEWKPIVNSVMTNVALPLVAENNELKTMVASIAAAQMTQAQQPPPDQTQQQPSPDQSQQPIQSPQNIQQ